MSHDARDSRPSSLVCLLVSLALAGVATAARTQDAPAPTAEPEPAFEVASVKKSGPPQPGPMSFGMRPNGRFSVSQISLAALITMAYGIQRYQLVGGPDWITTDRFDVNAKGEDGLSPMPPLTPGTANRMQLMLRSLLKDRFKLVVRHETREFALSHLVVARSDGRLGENLRPSTIDCAKLVAERTRAAGGGPPPAFQPPKPGEIPQCSAMSMPGRVAGAGVPLTMLVQMLTTQLNRPVVDRTGLKGNFDILLEYTPDRMPTIAPGATLPPGMVLPSPDGPSLLTAIQEQLGLKIENTRGPVDVLVIDSVEPPAPD